MDIISSTLGETEINARKKLQGKYLTFRLADEEYGLQILKVQEIIQMQAVTKVPGIPEYARGVINLRGKVIPVIELRKSLVYHLFRTPKKPA